MLSLWCATHSATPRKHAHTEPTASPLLTVTLGNETEDRQVSARYQSGEVIAQVSITVAMLRAMLKLAEEYKPGATLQNPDPR
jgi:hypothetical protein